MIGIILSAPGCSSTSSFGEQGQELEPVRQLPERCALLPASGKCKAAFRYYYFNQDVDRCEVFIYGGCGGVVPFKTLVECQTACAPK
ncbi:MAG: hypothetical protein CSA52_01355 [Gammaproteobacteria bacterium]|nr:MAG: hypothetical protein CSB48_09865 [Pseudomonadota bacterium]PIE38745.1 MAG: hypothetical protein CSA52_01355 [Gammaproteobacteria bacterium]